MLENENAFIGQAAGCVRHALQPSGRIIGGELVGSLGAKGGE
jgi:hypothetical protein